MFVSLRAVGRTFPNGLVALGGLDLDLREGEFLSLLGPSGCGKSTALRIVAGLDAPTVGRVEWRAGALDRSRDIGFVFQDPTLMPWASAADNVRLPLRLQGVSSRASAARVDEALARVGLEAFREALPRELSGGMRMRVSIARALVTKPRLLLMDEPFAALDEIARFRLNDDLLGLWRDLGCTILFVTHSVYESVYLSTRIAVLSARPGRVIGEVAVPSMPRDGAFRASPPYLAATRAASALLGDALNEGESGGLPEAPRIVHSSDVP